MNRKEILDTAIKTVCEERQDSYGKPENNFAIIADLWSGYLGGVVLKAEDVAIMMILLKIARIRTGRFKPDNYIDIAGYAACAAEVAGGQCRNLLILSSLRRLSCLRQRPLISRKTRPKSWQD